MKIDDPISSFTLAGWSCFFQQKRWPPRIDGRRFNQRCWRAFPSPFLEEVYFAALLSMRRAKSITTFKVVDQWMKYHWLLTIQYFYRRAIYWQVSFHGWCSSLVIGLIGWMAHLLFLFMESVVWYMILSIPFLFRNHAEVFIGIQNGSSNSFIFHG